MVYLGWFGLPKLRLIPINIIPFDHIIDCTFADISIVFLKHFDLKWVYFTEGILNGLKISLRKFSFSGCRVHSERAHRQREQHPQLVDIFDVPSCQRTVAVQRARRHRRLHHRRVERGSSTAFVQENRQNAEQGEHCLRVDNGCGVVRAVVLKPWRRVRMSLGCRYITSICFQETNFNSLCE